MYYFKIFLITNFSKSPDVQSSISNNGKLDDLVMFCSHDTYFTLKVLIDFCLVQREFLTCCFVTKTFDVLPEMIIEYQIQTKLLHILSLQACIQICLIKIEDIFSKNEDFGQTYLNTGSKAQNVEELTLDLIFHNNFW